jgi:hypothetical protein
MPVANNYATQPQQQYPTQGVIPKNKYVSPSNNQTGYSQNVPPLPMNMSHISNKDSKIMNMSKLNSSKLNRTIVNELMDPSSD